MEKNNDPFEKDAEKDEEIIDLFDIADETDDQEDILDLTDAADDSLEDVIALAEPVVENLQPESEDHILNLTEAMDEADDDSDIVTASPVSVPAPSDDQEILDLIDDIQSTLDETGSPDVETGLEYSTIDPDEETALSADEIVDKAPEPAIILGNGDPIDTDNLIETETNLVDNLGIDLTSEFNRDILDDADDMETTTGQAGDSPFEAADSTLGERVETIVARILDEKLENIIGKRIEEAVAREIKKQMP